MKTQLIKDTVRCFGPVLALEGNIASGKTSVLNELKKLLPNSIVYEEPVDKWRNLGGQNILDLMYQDPKRWGFLFQSYVQLTMFAIHQKIMTNPHPETCHILERSIYSARYCFVENFRKSKVMEDVEVEVVDGWLRFLTDTNRCPTNLIVYLRTNPECVYKRLLQRARPEEREISPDYIEQLHELHECWLLPQVDKENCPATIRPGEIIHNRTMLPKCPVLVVDATQSWKNVCEQLREFVVPAILSHTHSQKQSHPHQSPCKKMLKSEAC